LVLFGGDIMAKNTSISLGDHLEGFINRQIESGRYGSTSEVIRASLRLLEEHEQRLGALRQALIDGENSGDAGELDMNEIKRKARRVTRGT
jgi:antitoxin ParD1/3/4